MPAHKRCQFCSEKFFSKKALFRHRIAKGHVTRTMEIPSFTPPHRTEIKMQNHKPEYSYSDALVKAGHTMPEALLSKLIAENRTAIGVGIRTKSAMEKEIFYPLKPVEQTLAFMKKFFEATKEFTRLVRFHSMPENFDEDVEIGPWCPLKSSKGEPLLFVGIEGDFPDFIDKSADHFSEASRLMVDWLGPKIETLYGTAGNRPDKVFDYLRSDAFSQDLAAHIGHRAVLSFLPITGEAFYQGKNEIGVRGDWGTASVAYGYTEAVPEAATPAPKETKEDMKPVAKKASKYVDDDLPVEPAKPEAKPEAPVQAPLKNGQEMVEEEIEVTSPKGMHGKQLKLWWRKSPFGDLPSNWRDPNHVEKVKVKKPVKAAETKKTDTAMAAAMASAEANKPAPLTMPIVGGDKQKAANEFVKKYVGDGSALITDPAVTAEQESKLAKWHELAGEKSLSSINQYSTAFLSAYVKSCPEMAWLLLIEQRSELNRLQKVVEGLVAGTVKAGELVKTGTENAPSTQEPATAQPEAQPEPLKKASGSKYL